MNMNQHYPQDREFRRMLDARYRVATLWQALFLSALLIAIVSLMALIYNVVDGAFGYIAYEYKKDPAQFTSTPIANLTQEELAAILKENLSSGAYKKLNNEQPVAERSQADLFNLFMERLVQLDTKATWSMTDSLMNGEDIRAEVAEKYPKAQLEFRSWLTPQFLVTPMSSKAEFAGVRTAVLGSLWLVGIAILFALPIGTGAAIYLQEYAPKNWFTAIIQTNINNLAGVPSIVYGMLGLAIFVRVLEPLTSGALFGVTDSNGRTILSAGLTMGVLVLPLIIINAQEAIKAVPDSLRQAAYGVGATRWQTVWYHVLPNSLPGILTGSILALSRALGETAPLIVVGASTFISLDPSGPFSKFTALPIQIYQWTTRAQSEFHAIAAGAIIVLLVLLLSLNATAVLLRNRFQRRW
ncbi:MAG TPA: phosphate ABC transporter permease PstA [Anaerolineales bacterium]|nr:phosphate ABC transporter permease PstA [Anaerolineales bacterium]HNA55498.1 phosphate ABC transporter permease PstA [Anaerolineales bacterium]HNB87759.1 phosphate ABC transporter permease PstA [Anaerolineales bacterium]HNC90583.1 phosphate ABC transporter permease PstA [Anaerolineales bacterium]HND92444.1 phosphate ABC transporter permease PstA [Anaerolineales bacterium]